MLFNSSEWEILTRSNFRSGVPLIRKSISTIHLVWNPGSGSTVTNFISVTNIHNQHQFSRMSQKLLIHDCLTRLLRHSSSLFNLLSNPWCWSISRSLLRILKNCRIKFILCHVRFLKNWIVYTGFNGLIALDRKYLTYVDLCCQVFSNIFFEINSFKFESVKWQFQIT